MSIYLYRLARLMMRRRRIVLAAWLILVIGIIVLARASGGKTNDVFTIPGTESQHAADVLKQKIPALSGGQTTIVFAVKDGSIADAAHQAAISAAFANLKSVPQVISLANPYSAKLVSASGDVALGTVRYSVAATSVADRTLADLQAAVRPAQAAGIQVEYSGSVYPGWRLKPPETPELIGVIIAFGILLVMFGALVTAGLPILTAIIGVAFALMTITAVASVVNIASASTTVAIMLGLSCGIDYGLFILSRHRNNLMRGMTVEESIPLAVGTAGGSVVFAALTVIIALCGLSVVGIPFLSVLGLAAAGAVLTDLLISLTLMPAVLGFAGLKIVRFIPLGGHFARVADIAANHPEQTLGARWARFVVRFRVPLFAGGVLALGVIAIPALSLQLGLGSAASKPASDTSRQAYDLTTAAFGVGFNGPLLVIADISRAGADAGSRLVAALKKEADVGTVTAGAPVNKTLVIQVVPKTGPNDPATAHLVRALRDDRAAIEGRTGATILVGGTTASNIDVSSKLSSALAPFLLVVVGLAFILLTFAFRTIFVPIKSIVGFLLSVFAAFGAEVAVFQWGWGQALTGTVPSETVSYLPIIMLAIIFGLSSDYEVFVVSRIKEDFTKTGDARGAVQRGTGLSARVVTSAALVMFSIFVAFMLTSDPVIRAIGFSFAVGVFLDAFVVRLLLVPAIMAIAGDRIWYHPKWFARHVPDPDIEGERLGGLLAGPANPGPVTPVAPVAG